MRPRNKDWLDPVEADPFLGNHDAGVDAELDDDDYDGFLSEIETDEQQTWTTAGDRSSRWPPRARWLQPNTRRGRWQSLIQNLPTLKTIPIESTRKIIVVLTLIKFCVVASSMMLLIPMTRIIEDAFCHVHYGKDPSEHIDEKECKVDEVQEKLAWIGGLGALITSIITMIVAFPYGIFSDRVGRKPALLLSYTGILLAFAYGPLLLTLSSRPPVWLLLFGSVFFLIGGGVPVGLNTLYAMASDLGTEQERSANFLYLSIGSVAGGLLGPVAAGVLMEVSSPWAAILAFFAASPVVYVLVLILPETLRVTLPQDPGSARADGLFDRSSPATPMDADVPFPLVAKERLRSGLANLRESFAVVARNRNIMLCLPVFLISSPLFVAQSSTLTQYISKYFGWTLARISFLLSPLSLVNMAVLGALPWISARLVDPRGRLRLSNFAKDVTLARASIACVALAFTMQGLSPNLGLFLTGLVVGTLGSAMLPLARAVVTDCVESEQTSRLYALLSIVETAGSPLGGPALAWCFSTGMRHGGVWRGLPWFYVACLTICALVAFFFVRGPQGVRLPQSPEPGSAQDEEGQMGYESAYEDD